MKKRKTRAFVFASDMNEPRVSSVKTMPKYANTHCQASRAAPNQKARDPVVEAPLYSNARANRTSNHSGTGVDTRPLTTQPQKVERANMVNQHENLGEKDGWYDVRRTCSRQVVMCRIRSKPRGQSSTVVPPSTPIHPTPTWSTYGVHS